MLLRLKALEVPKKGDTEVAVECRMTASGILCQASRHSSDDLRITTSYVLREGIRIVKGDSGGIGGSGGGFRGFGGGRKAWRGDQRPSSGQTGPSSAPRASSGRSEHREEGRGGFEGGTGAAGPPSLRSHWPARLKVSGTAIDVGAGQGFELVGVAGRGWIHRAGGGFHFPLPVPGSGKALPEGVPEGRLVPREAFGGLANSWRQPGLDRWRGGGKGVGVGFWEAGVANAVTALPAQDLPPPGGWKGSGSGGVSDRAPPGPVGIPSPSGGVEGSDRVCL